MFNGVQFERAQYPAIRASDGSEDAVISLRRKRYNGERRVASPMPAASANQLQRLLVRTMTRTLRSLHWQRLERIYGQSFYRETEAYLKWENFLILSAPTLENVMHLLTSKQT